MKASERRLLMVVIALAGVLGLVVGVTLLRKWQHGIERREREVELAQMESTALVEQAPQWLARKSWLDQAQPVATGEYDANQGLFDSLTQSARTADLTVASQQIELTKPDQFYRPYGVALTLKGEYATMMRWIHTSLTSGPFYVMPFLQITPNPEDEKQLIAKMRILRWYSPEFAAATSTPESAVAPVPESAVAPVPEAPGTPTPAPETVPTPDPIPVPLPAPAPVPVPVPTAPPEAAPGTVPAPAPTKES